MKSPKRKTLGKKPKLQKRQPDMDTSPSTVSINSDELEINSSSDVMIDLGNYGAAQSTYTIGNIDTITLDSAITSYSTVGQTLSWSNDYSNYTFGPNNDTAVNITPDGIFIKEGSDIKLGGHSLGDFIKSVEDRLAILKPNPELEEKWEQLKDLRRQYEALEKDILEKEKIMKILKED